MLFNAIQSLDGVNLPAAGEWLYYGATVHDITDTWLAIALLKVWAIVFRDLRDLEVILLDLALTHRDTPMPGRTHGQPGLPITFGFKVVVWVREVRRHIDRLKDIRPRLGRGELAGGVGSLSSFGERGFEVQERFFAKLGLRPPDIVWNTARDTLVEFINLLAMMGATFDKIGQEIYNLQRPEIGEVREGFVSGTVGSITMPHKRNPEIGQPGPADPAQCRLPGRKFGPRSRAGWALLEGGVGTDWPDLRHGWGAAAVGQNDVRKFAGR